MKYCYLSLAFVTKSSRIIPIALMLIWIGLSGCENNAEAPTLPESPVPVQPSDCNRASGYFWSELKGDCIELFAIARKLKAASGKVNQHGSVLVVFNADSSKVEMYMPFTRQETIIMDQVSSSHPARWKNDQYTLIGYPAMQLMEGEEILYQELVKQE